MAQEAGCAFFCPVKRTDMCTNSTIQVTLSSLIYSSFALSQCETVQEAFYTNPILDYISFFTFFTFLRLLNYSYLVHIGCTRTKFPLRISKVS